MILALAQTSDVVIAGGVILAAALAALIGFLSIRDDDHLRHLEDELEHRPLEVPRLRTYSVFDWAVRDPELAGNDDGPGRSRTRSRVDQQPTAR